MALRWIYAGVLALMPFGVGCAGSNAKSSSSSAASAPLPPLPPAERPAKQCDRGDAGALDPLEATMVVQRNREGLPTRMYLNAMANGQPQLLWIDTGAARSHAFHPITGSHYAIPNAAHVVVGCAELTLESWRHRPEPVVDGVPVIATLGADRFVANIIEIDLRANRFIEHKADNAVAAALGTGPEWTRIPIEIVRGIAITSAVVDGKNLRLFVDTGVWNLQIIDADAPPPSPDDLSRTPVKDVWGNALVFTRGEAQLGLGGAKPRQVHVARTRSFPAFEQLRDERGGNINGALGISSLGASRIVYDFPHNEVRFAP